MRSHAILLCTYGADWGGTSDWAFPTGSGADDVLRELVSENPRRRGKKRETVVLQCCYLRRLMSGIYKI